MVEEITLSAELGARGRSCPWFAQIWKDVIGQEGCYARIGINTAQLELSPPSFSCSLYEPLQTYFLTVKYLLPNIY